MEEEIFKVELNEQGVYWLRRLYGLAKAILVAAVVVNLISLVTTLSYFFQSDRLAGTSSSMRWRNLIYVSYLMVSFVLQVVQIVFYRRFAAKAMDAIEASNTKAFNDSFRWLVLQSVLFLIQILIAFVYLAYAYVLNRA